MLLLTGTGDKIEVVTSAALPTEVHASYVDHQDGVITPARQNTLISTATTTTVVAAPGSGVQRNVQTLVIRNGHASSSNTVIVQHHDGAFTSKMYSATLTAGQAIQFLDGQGFRVLTADGAIGPAGPAGPTGPTGATGPAGANGLDGKTVLNGTVNPTSEGVNGDFYINTATSRLFGPKTAGGWGSGVSLIGPAGSGGGLPSGGSQFMSLRKNSSTDGDASWSNVDTNISRHWRCFNNTGTTMAPGTVVKIVGMNSGVPIINRVAATAMTELDVVLGVVAESIPNNTTGSVCTAGAVGPFDTSSWTPGAALYVHASTPGALQNTRPTNALAVGYVLESGFAAGTMLVHLGRL